MRPGAESEGSEVLAWEYVVPTMARDFRFGHTLVASHFARSEAWNPSTLMRRTCWLGGEGVGLGHEVLLQDPVTGVGLEYEGSLVHVAAFPAGARQHP